MEMGFRHKNVLGCQHAQQMKDAQHYATKEQKKNEISKFVLRGNDMKKTLKSMFCE